MHPSYRRIHSRTFICICDKLRHRSKLKRLIKIQFAEYEDDGQLSFTMDTSYPPIYGHLRSQDGLYTLAFQTPSRMNIWNRTSVPRVLYPIRARGYDRGGFRIASIEGRFRADRRDREAFASG